MIEHTDLLDTAASDLIELLEAQDFSTLAVDRVVGPQTGATKLAELMAKRMRCLWSSPAKSGEGDEKAMVFSSEEAALLFGESVLLCEDVLTTGGSVNLAAKAIVDAGGELLPFIAVLVNRSGLHTVDGRQIAALIDHHMPTWSPEDCPLCKEGSEPVRPKENWERLNASYD